MRIPSRTMLAALAYLAIAWLTVQVLDVTGPILGIPISAVRLGAQLDYFAFINTVRNKLEEEILKVFRWY